MTGERPSDGKEGEGPAGRSGGRLLVAEDDEMLAQFLRRLLEDAGHEVEFAVDGPAVLSALREDHRLLLLDLNLPGLDGLEVLERIRPRFPGLPVLVLTGRNRAEGLLPALDGGADDCLLKPFSYLELLARVRALLRRSAPQVEAVSRCADLELDRAHGLVRRGGTRIELTQREFALLEQLMRTPERPVPRSQLLEKIWGETASTSTNVVDVYMKYVRDKIDLPGLPKLVKTIRGTGYMVSAG